MLSEDAIENLMRPLIDRAEQINIFVIETIAARIKQIGEAKPSDLYKLEQLIKTGADIALIEKELSRLTKLQLIDLQNLLYRVALENYFDAKWFYEYRKMTFIPFKENEPLQRAVQAISRETGNTFKNLSNSRATGFLIRDLRNPTKLKFQSIGDTYKSVVDEAIQAAQGGIIDYNTAMRRTMTQLVNSGVRRLTWDSGYTQRLDTAVRRNVLNGIRAVNQQMQDLVGEQFGSDGKEISVHLFSAPDHEPVQGHQFKNEEYEKLQSAETFEDVDGEVFDPIERAIGMWNCRHYTFSIIVGATKPNYTKEQLEELKKRNAAGYQLPNGKRLSMYECTQYQRELETKVRKYKDGQIAARASGDMELAKKYQAKINQATAEYKAFSTACGLSPKTNRMSVSGYEKISVK